VILRAVEKAIPRRRVVEENDVAGLLAARTLPLRSILQDVAVADIGSGERNALAGESALEAEIRHGSGDDAVAGEFVLRIKEARAARRTPSPLTTFRFRRRRARGRRRHRRQRPVWRAPRRRAVATLRDRANRSRR